MLVEITIPTYNEANILEHNITKLVNFLKKITMKYRITIADNGSKDSTLKIAKRLAHIYPNVHVFHTDIPGRGNALKNVWKKSKADFLVYMDADLSTDISHFQEMINLLEKNDVVVGNRLAKSAKVQRRFYRSLLSRGYNLLVKSILRVRTNDIQCGFKGIKKEVFLELINHTPSNGWFFDTELIVWAEKNHYRIAELPISWKERKNSKVKIISTTAKYLADIYKLMKKINHI